VRVDGCVGLVGCVGVMIPRERQLVRMSVCVGRTMSRVLPPRFMGMYLTGPSKNTARFYLRDVQVQ
jgi:hypothetical protein